ncbi:MAG: cobalt-precorrin-5B (C(1))-methyltransferase CbiD [Calditerrivibrio sp.]|nr:cobalt-precorrin-5B (C(1))-methyltransferase CbiD [Calditerrivibrio sp.]
MGLILSNGITTGSAAAAAAKGIVLKKFKGFVSDTVSVELPSGEIVEIPVTLYDDFAVCRKWSVESDDVTNGIEIIARAEVNREGTINIIGGKGIGVVTKKGLQIPVGEKAINPVPMKMIKGNVFDVVGEGVGVDIILEVPEGEKIARKTFNSRLGIVDGISIIGTKGIINPMSEDAIKKTIQYEIDVKVFESDIIALTPGNIGEKSLIKVGIGNIVIVNNYFDFAFDYLKSKNIKKIIVGGHPGKLGKLIAGEYNTHSKRGISAVDIIKEKLGLSGDYNTAEEISRIINLDNLAIYISAKLKEDFNFERVSVFLFRMDGSLCGVFKDE